MSKQIRADLFLLAITAIWGSSFILMKNVLQHIPAFAYLSLRFIIASVVLVVIFHRSFRHMNRRALKYGCIIGLMLFGGMALQVSGLYYTTASNSAFITGLNVVMVPVVSAMLLKKKPDRSSVAGVALAFAGLFFLTGGLDFHFNLGDFLTLLCAVCFTLQIIFIDKFTNDQDPALLSVIQIAFSGILYTGVWLFVDFKPVVWNTSVVITLLITGILGTALAFAGQTIVQRFTSPTHTALIFTAEPVFGAVFAALIPNVLGMTETFKLHTLIGCALILAGMLISEFMPGKREKSGDRNADVPEGA
jgi:drug/metabolite transporter (DMT)-like permease